VPELCIRLRDENETGNFWNTYGGNIDFEVRKRYSNKRKPDGKVRSCRFVCSKEGHREQDKRDHLVKCLHYETRTDCPVRMSLTLDREIEDYEVSYLVLEHNHALCLPETLSLDVIAMEYFRFASI
jgi:zinc finger SWIM domain-containing protein 3